MRAILGGKIVTPSGVLDGMAVVFEETIVSIVPQSEIPQNADVICANGKYVLPGLVDMHIHGYLGADASDGDFEGLKTMAEGVCKNGVTAFLPTTMTVSDPELRSAFAQIRLGMRESWKESWRGAQIMGANAEGPFINASKKGAQAGEHVKKGDPAFLKEFQDVIRVFTIAPEVEGNLDCIREIAQDTNLLISMGHTAANYAQACEGIEAGVRHVTHLFNAQTGLNHRDPGVVGAGLTDGRVSCELIADTFHIHPALFALVARMKRDKMVLITDCTRAGGLADGEYTLGGQPIFVHGIECRLADGTIAGSVLKLNEAIRSMRAHTDLPLNQIVNMASLNPARRIGIDHCKGSIESGKDADFANADENLHIVQTILRGKTIYQE